MDCLKKVHPHSTSEMHRKSDAGMENCEERSPDPNVSPEIKTDRIWNLSPHSVRADQQRRCKIDECCISRCHAQTMAYVRVNKAVGDGPVDEHGSGRQPRVPRKAVQPIP